MLDFPSSPTLNQVYTANGKSWAWNGTSWMASGSLAGLQAWDADLDAIAALTGTSGLLKKTAENTWSLDTTSYQTQAGMASYLALSGGALTGGLREARVAMAANDIGLSSANYFTKTISGATSLTVSNVPAAGTAASFILDLTNGGSATITWWSGVKWAGGTAPTLTSAGRDVLGFFTHDGGTTWTGLVLGKDVK